MGDGLKKPNMSEVGIDEIRSPSVIIDVQQHFRRRSSFHA
jgi:hypothetical protein